MDIISPVVNGGWVDTEAVREQAADRQLPPGVEQRRDEQGKYKSFNEVPTNQAEESV